MTERTPEEWGRVAVSLPGWRWMPGMRWSTQTSLGLSHQRILDHEIDDFPPHFGCVPSPDDSATAGCLLALLGSGVDTCSCGDGVDVTIVDRGVSGHGKTLGRACCAAAEALGRWPGGQA